MRSRKETFSPPKIASDPSGVNGYAWQTTDNTNDGNCEKDIFPESFLKAVSRPVRNALQWSPKPVTGT